MKNQIEKWTGIISGTNRGAVILEIEYIEENITRGSISLYDLNELNLTCKMEGTIDDKNNITGKLSNFKPIAEGIPNSGTINVTITEDGKEMKGIWETDINTKGECVLYKFSTLDVKDLNISNTFSALETKDISISFSTFDKKSIFDIFSILTSIADSIQKEKEDEILPPIYTITYDKEESISTYDLKDFQNKFENSKQILYVAFAFNDKTKSTDIKIRISRQEGINNEFLSKASVQSSDKHVVALIPEMLRGLVSKTLNKHAFFHGWFFDAIVQIFGVLVILALSFLISKQCSNWSKIENIGVYSFITALILLANIWTYLRTSILNTFHYLYPVIEILNKPKNKIWPNIIIGGTSSIFAATIIYLISLLSKLLI